MAELLVKATDSRMPTVQEWRSYLSGYCVPKAAALSSQYGSIDKVINDKEKLSRYREALAVLHEASLGAAIGSNIVTDFRCNSTTEKGDHDEKTRRFACLTFASPDVFIFAG
jgi:hypothetical protein